MPLCCDSRCSRIEYRRISLRAGSHLDNVIASFTRGELQPAPTKVLSSRFRFLRLAPTYTCDFPICARFIADFAANRRAWFQHVSNATHSLNDTSRLNPAECLSEPRHLDLDCVSGDSPIRSK